MFCRYALRTTDVEGAQRFYQQAVGIELPVEDSASFLELWPLHERARARGAPPHWLGHVAVTDIEHTLDQMVQLGSERLGPTVYAADGTPFATLRDPFGAVVAVRATSERAKRPPVGWHQLHTSDVEGAWRFYSGLFSWRSKGRWEVVDPVGGHWLFGWNEAGQATGSMANTGRWPGVHQHWLFHLSVDSVSAVMARVRGEGGQAQGPFELPGGGRLAACEDPQGAAFGLVQVDR